MILEIVGKPEDVEKYKKLRNVGMDNMDPATGQLVEYGGLKRLNNTEDHENPYVKYGSEYRVAMGTIKSIGSGVKGKAWSEDERLDISGIANANIVDRHGEVVNPAGMDAKNFLQNRVILLDHMYLSRQVVGKAVELRPEADGVHFTAVIGDPMAVGGCKNLTEAQTETRSLIAQKLLQTVSIGFIPKKIRAPLYNDAGEMEEPAVIEQWELLEISIVAVPANAGSTFEQRSLAKSFNESNGTDTKLLTTDNKTDKTITKAELPSGLEAQRLEFDKSDYTLELAVEWAEANHYKAAKVEETEDKYLLRQRDLNEFENDSFQTISLETGIDAVAGKLSQEKSKMTDEQLKQLLEGLTALGVTMTEGFKAVSDQNEKVLGLVGTEKAKMDDEEDDKEDEKSIDRLEVIEKSISELGLELKKHSDALVKMFAMVNK